MSTNPYSHDHTIDDDIFDTDHGSHRHTFGNKTCKKHGCNLVHDVRVKDGVEIPPEIQEELSRLLDAVPKELRDKAVIVGEYNDGLDMYTSTRSAFLKFAHIVRAMNSDMPMTLALFEVLDEVSNGAVTRRYKVYEAEYSLININTIKKTLCSFRDWLQNSEPDPAPDQDTFRALDDLEVYLDSRIEHYTAEYIKACYDSDLPVDLAIVESGEPSSDRLMAKELLVNSLYKEMSILFEGRLIPTIESQSNLSDNDNME